MLMKLCEVLQQQQLILQWDAVHMCCSLQALVSLRPGGCCANVQHLLIVVLSNLLQRMHLVDCCKGKVTDVFRLA